ncbi:MAG: PspC domain-containing protein [Methanosarcina sp.]|nr:PspC domain-containing protein [Methanosarcina sp.]
MQENSESKEKKNYEESVSEAPEEPETDFGTESGTESGEESEEKTGEESEEKTGEESEEKTGEDKSTPYTLEKRLTRSKTNSMLFGVCGGIGEYFGIDPTLVRLAFVLLTLANGIGLVIYLILAIIMPSGESVEMPGSYENRAQSTWESPRQPGERGNENSDRNRLLGALLLIVGIYLLLDRLSIFRIFWWFDELFLPALLILGGGWLLLKHRK